MARRIGVTGAALALVGLLAAGCGGDGGNGPTPEQPFNILHLDFYVSAILPEGMVYELWVTHPNSTLVAATGTPQSLSRFTLQLGSGIDSLAMVDAAGHEIAGNTLSDLSIDFRDFDSLMITIEPDPDASSSPSSTIYFRGAIPNLPTSRIGRFEFPASHLKSLPDGQSLFTFTSPTDDDPDNPLSGVWFMNPVEQPGLQGLDPLPTGWVYEAWAIHQGYCLSTGRFIDPEVHDSSSVHCGPLAVPEVPGEDFLVVPPVPGPSFPLTFEPNDSVMVTVEPSPDTDRDNPFPLIILTSPSGMVPAAGQVFLMDSHPEGFPTAQGVFSQPEEN